MSQNSPIDAYLYNLCKRAGLRFVQADCQAEQPGVMATDNEGIREFYTLAALTAESATARDMATLP